MPTLPPGILLLSILSLAMMAIAVAVNTYWMDRYNKIFRKKICLEFDVQSLGWAKDTAEMKLRYAKEDIARKDAEIVRLKEGGE